MLSQFSVSLVHFWTSLSNPVYRLHLWSSDFDQPISLVLKSFRIPLSDSSDRVTLPFLTLHGSFSRKSCRSPPTCPLHRVMMNNTCLRCMTASAGTIIRRDFSSTTVILLVKFRPLQLMLSSVFGVAGSGFRPLTKILDCCLPLKSGSFSTPVRRYGLSTPLSILGLVSLYLTNYLRHLVTLAFLLLHGPRLSFFYSGIPLERVLPNVLLCPR